MWLEERARVLNPLRRVGIRLNPYHRYLTATERAMFENPDLKVVICNSKMVAGEIRSRFRIDPAKIRVIYSGVDSERFHPRLRSKGPELRGRWGIPAAAPLLLFVGSGFERKGLAPLVRALSRLPEGVHLLVVGTDKHAARYRRLAERLGLMGRVHFAGGQEDVSPFYGAADLLALPALYDPFPNVALEGMAAGLPLLTSYKCGASDLIEEGVNGFLCDALDEEGIAERIRQMLEPRRREAMGEMARSTVEPLTMEAMGGKLVALYREVLGVDAA